MPPPIHPGASRSPSRTDILRLPPYPDPHHPVKDFHQLWGASSSSSSGEPIDLPQRAAGPDLLNSASRLATIPSRPLSSAAGPGPSSPRGSHAAQGSFWASPRRPQAPQAPARASGRSLLLLPTSGRQGRRRGARRTEAAPRPRSRCKGLCESPTPGPGLPSLSPQGPAPPLTRARGGCHLASLSLEGRPLLHPPPVPGPFCAGVRGRADAAADARSADHATRRGEEVFFFSSFLVRVRKYLWARGPSNLQVPPSSGVKEVLRCLVRGQG